MSESIGKESGREGQINYPSLRRTYWTHKYRLCKYKNSYETKSLCKDAYKSQKRKWRKDKESGGMYQIILLKSHIYFCMCPCVLNIYVF